MAPIYTRRGDDGTTSVPGRKRLAKSHLLIATLGDIDELNAALGLARSHSASAEAAQLIEHIQQDLITLSSEIAVDDKMAQLSQRITPEDIARLEATIDAREAKLPELTGFVLPGPPGASAVLHMARAVCRRAERCVVELHREKPVRPELLAYLNRLSDLLFVMAREAAQP
jgi:cob(I)alamin adenosyltransferase